MTTTRTDWAQRFSERMGRVRASEIRELLKLLDQPDILSFAGGIPNPALFPTPQIQASYDAILSDPVLAAQALQYSVSEGYLPLRQWIAERMSRDGVPCDAQNIMLTAGSQQALDLLAKVRGDSGVMAELAAILQKPILRADLYRKLQALTAPVEDAPVVPAPPQEPVRAVKVMSVGSSAFQSSHEFAAEVRPRVESRLGFRVGGKIIRRQAEQGLDQLGLAVALDAGDRQHTGADQKIGIAPPVAQHGRTRRDVDQSHLVALRHLVLEHQAAGQGGAGGQAAVVGHDGHVVALVHADGVGRARAGHGGGHGGFSYHGGASLLP